MPAVEEPAYKNGDFLVDYKEKVFEDVKAQKGEGRSGTTAASRSSVSHLATLAARPDKG